MTQHTIELSETIYQLLLKQAADLQLPPERVLEQLVLGDLAFPALDDPQTELLHDAISTADALAAVERPSSLFADMPIANLEQYLDDPMLELANADIEDLLR